MKRRKGFTLVEICIVIAVIGILLTVGIGGYNLIMKSSRVKSAYLKMETTYTLLKAEDVKDDGFVNTYKAGYLVYKEKGSKYFYIATVENGAISDSAEEYKTTETDLVAKEIDITKCDIYTDGRSLSNYNIYTSVNSDSIVDNVAFFTTSSLITYAKGDVNGDGEIDLDDAIYVEQYIVGLKTFTDREFEAADVNSDGVVDSNDATLIRNYIAGTIVSFKVYVKGDVNGDGQIGLDDSILVEQYIAGSKTFTDVQFNAADVNSDGVVNLDDGILIKQYIAGSITSFD